MATSDRAAAGFMPATSVTGPAEDMTVRRERRLAEFHSSVRPRIAALTLGAPAFEDLADSFPGLLFALASGYNEGPARDAALALTLQGAGLRQIADALELPLWLRRLPPAAFTELMPRLPTDADFGIRLGSFIPTDRRRASAWLLGISDAHLTGGREFTLWMARAWSPLLAATPPNRTGLAAAWYWYSSQPGTHGHALLRGGWNAQQSTSAAAEDINTWLKRVALVEWLGTGTFEPWIPDAQIGLYEFQTLRRAEDFIAAAAELDNCLEQFASRLSNGVSTVARITRGGRIVACIEVGLHEADPSMPSIIQLRGHKNKRVSAELWRKAYDWLSHAPIEPFQSDRLTPPASDRNRARQVLWMPFITALEHHPDPAGKVAAARQRRALLPRLRSPAATIRRTSTPVAEICDVAADRQPTMLQRVREHIATLTGFPHEQHELMRWDAVDRLEEALRGRRTRT